MSDNILGGQQPDLEGLINNILGGNTDLGDIDLSSLGGNLQKQQADMARKMRWEANLFRDVFLETDRGREVLEAFLENTLRQPAWPVFEIQSLEMLMVMGVWREAQNAFVRAIIEAIALAESSDDDDEEGDD